MHDLSRQRGVRESSVHARGEGAGEAGRADPIDQLRRSARPRWPSSSPTRCTRTPRRRRRSRRSCSRRRPATRSSCASFCRRCTRRSSSTSTASDGAFRYDAAAVQERGDHRERRRVPRGQAREAAARDARGAARGGGRSAIGSSSGCSRASTTRSVAETAAQPAARDRRRASSRRSSGLESVDRGRARSRRSSTADSRSCHDRVQQAAYATLPEAERPALHLAIGRAGARAAHPRRRDREPALRHRQSLESRHRADRRRRRAPATRRSQHRAPASKARDSTAYDLAVRCFRHAIELVGESGWRDRYEVQCDLHERLAESLGLVADYSGAFAVLDAALEHAASMIDRAKLYTIKTNVLLIMGRIPAALACGREAARMFDVDLPEEKRAGSRAAAARDSNDSRAHGGDRHREPARSARDERIPATPRCSRCSRTACPRRTSTIRIRYALLMLHDGAPVARAR